MNADVHVVLCLHTQSPNAQCIAIGNLGLLAIRQGDTPTAETCLKQHLQLTRGKSKTEVSPHFLRTRLHVACCVAARLSVCLYTEIGDKASELDALLRLGQLKKECRRSDEALKYYEEAQQLAEDEGEIGYMKRIACLIGVCQGDQKLDSYMLNLKLKASRAGVPVI